MKKLYVNTNDYQTKEWAVGIVDTLKGWRNRAMFWAECDDNWGVYNLLKSYKIKNKELIDFINDFWDIEIVEYDKEKHYDFELEESLPF